jgi:hypothetical protein
VLPAPLSAIVPDEELHDVSRLTVDKIAKTQTVVLQIFS